MIVLVSLSLCEGLIRAMWTPGDVVISQGWHSGPRLPVGNGFVSPDHKSYICKQISWWYSLTPFILRTYLFICFTEQFCLVSFAWNSLEWILEGHLAWSSADTAGGLYRGLWNLYFAFCSFPALEVSPIFLYCKKFWHPEEINPLWLNTFLI